MKAAFDLAWSALESCEQGCIGADGCLKMADECASKAVKIINDAYATETSY